jgi:predicted porin
MGYQANNKVRNYAVTGGQFYANDYAYTIAGGYDFGFIRPALAYEHMKYDTPTGDLKRDYWAVSAIVPAGAGVLFAFYGQLPTVKEARWTARVSVASPRARTRDRDSTSRPIPTRSRSGPRSTVGM